jgi:hypothetical protein
MGNKNNWGNGGAVMEEKNTIEALTFFGKCKELHEIVLKTALMMEKFSDTRRLPEWEILFNEKKWSPKFAPCLETVPWILRNSFGLLWRTADNISLLHNSLPNFAKNRSELGPDMIRSLPRQDDEIQWYIQKSLDACFFNTSLLVDHRMKYIHSAYEKFTIIPREEKWNLQEATPLECFIGTRIFQINALISFWSELQKALPEVV